MWAFDVATVTFLVRKENIAEHIDVLVKLDFNSDFWPVASFQCAQ